MHSEPPERQALPGGQQHFVDWSVGIHSNSGEGEGEERGEGEEEEEEEERFVSLQQVNGVH